MNKQRLTGLVAAAHSPFKVDWSLNLAAVEAQAAYLLRQNILTVFVAGSSGESHSLTLKERLELAQRWIEVTQGTPLKVVVHVGSNCLGDAQTLAAQAGKLGVGAISALAPSYFKPATLDGLVEWCVPIAAAAPETPFYYYNIPVLTGAHFSMPEFLAKAADRIPTLSGIKFSNNDLMGYQLCLRLDGGAFDIPWGVDEALLGAWSLGAQGAIGTSYNFAAPIYHRLLRSFAAQDLATARLEQFRGVQLINHFISYGVLAATKAVMGMLGVEVGPVRRPLASLSNEQITKLRGELERLGFFDWITSDKPQPTLSP